MNRIFYCFFVSFLIIATAVSASEIGSSSFMIGVVSDAHVTLDENLDNNAQFATALQGIGAVEPSVDLIVHTGDCVDHLFLPWSASPGHYIGENAKTVPVIEEYKRIVKENVHVPYYDVVGNHEMYWNVVWSPRMKSTKPIVNMLLTAFAEMGSMPAPYYVVEHKGVNLIVLNSLSKAVNHAGSWVGGFDDAQMDMLEAQLETGKPAVLFFHHYPITPEFERHASRVSGHLMPETERIYGIVEKYSKQIGGIFVGHGELFVHGELSGVPVYMTGNPHEAPGYHIVEITAEPLSVRIVNEKDIAYNAEITNLEE